MVTEKDYAGAAPKLLHMKTHSTAQKVALVTGASREIGAAMVEVLAQAGYAVMAAYWGETERVTPLVEHLQAHGHRIEAYEADLSRVETAAGLIRQCVERFGRLDVFAANAGLTIARSFLETTEQDWDIIANLNMKGSYFGAQAAARQMIQQGQKGRIIFSSSVTGVRACEGMSAYGISKAALRHMAKVLALELAPYQITVNALGIGAILNDRNRADNPEYERDWDSIVPLGRVGQPGDIAATLCFLASEQASWITGQTIIVDGGWTLSSPMP